MRWKRLEWRFYFSCFLVSLCALLVFAFFMSAVLREFYLQETTKNLEAKAELVKAGIMTKAGAPPAGTLQQQCLYLAALAKTRITIINAQGTVLADSEKKPENMENHADRPEIAAALRGQVHAVGRYSYTLEKDMMYLATPCFPSGQAAAVVRLALPTTVFSRALATVYRQLFFIVVLLAGVMAAISWILARAISQPLETMRQGAERFAQGDLQHKMTIPKTPELAGLASSLNAMAAQLDERFHTIARQRQELHTVLDSMAEGVVAVDNQENIMNINPAAARLFNKAGEEVTGRSIQEVIRYPEILDFISRIPAAGGMLEDDLVFYQEGREKTIRAQGSPLYDERGDKIGALLVMQDITRQRRLESIRRDFVANVSHELKTPLTSIQGFVETLQDGAWQNAKKSREFLGIISKHIVRLNAIIEDLLQLSRIEQCEQGKNPEKQKMLLRPMVESALQLCAENYKGKRQAWTIQCEEDLAAEANPPLLEQALVNLIDNAMKYGPAGMELNIRARQSEQEIMIEVADKGPGIAPQHLPRIFERFYRVDKARSRKVGGTGLGLAIVKHIMLAHKGRVQVQSTLGQGSVFTLILPANE
ncbi:PAS domain-containing protein [candidate division FCPU426 bacterium]|nr:PAS domain-containing protein [candidate division FCPU426 bacterium]